MPKASANNFQAPHADCIANLAKLSLVHRPASLEFNLIKHTQSNEFGLFPKQL